MRFGEGGDLVFTQGEHPTLLRKGYRFRRFSSKVSGRLAGEVEHYLRKVKSIAVRHFGAIRVKWWSEYYDDYGIYEWDEVNKARRGEMDDEASDT